MSRDLAASEIAQTAMRKRSRKEGNGVNAFSLMEESYRLDVKVYADEKALGIACFSRPPREPIKG